MLAKYTSQVLDLALLASWVDKRWWYMRRNHNYKVQILVVLELIRFN